MSTIQNLINRAITYMASLATDGGPSATRWVFLRTAEVVSLGWLCIVFTVIYRIVRFGVADGTWLGLIFTLAGALFGFSALNQNTKLTLDAKKIGDPSVVSTPGGTITSGEQVKE